MRTNAEVSYDVVVVGAGFSGLYLLWKLRGQGMNVHLFEAADDVGGTWFWNRYPGARCDVESVDYSFSFDDALQQEWKWKERYPAQPEILEYLQHVADRFDLRRDISLETRVRSAHYDEDARTWAVHADNGSDVTARFVIMATGCLSVPQTPNIPGLESFAGETYHTGYWPKAGVDFDGKRVGVIGTGSSGIQLIPEVAKHAEHVTVFQRTASFSVPALNGPLDPEFERAVKADYAGRRRRARASSAGVERGDNAQNALDVAHEDRIREYDGRWGKGGFALLGAYQDLMLDDAANDTVSDYVRDKIRATVDDPETAEALIPRGYPLGAKRICVDTDYFETYNRDNVTLVDLRKSPLDSITARGARTAAADYEFDVLCLATGFDAMTGALDRIDIRGIGGETLKNKWRHGPTTYLGLGVSGFPNLLLIAGSGSPSVLSNMVTAIEQHVEWTSECLAYMASHGYETIEPTQKAEDEWVAHVNELASYTVYPKAASWYMGANIPGKPRIFMPYIGGCVEYEKKCNEIAAADYAGFVLK